MSRKLLEGLRKLRRPEACRFASCSQCAREGAILGASEPCGAEIGTGGTCAGELRAIPDREPIYVQALSGQERMEFGDFMDELEIDVTTDANGKQIWSGGQQGKAFKVAVFTCQCGVVDENGRRQFESFEDAEKVLGDIEPSQIVFDIAQRIMDMSGLSASSKEAAVKN